MHSSCTQCQRFALRALPFGVPERTHYSINSDAGKPVQPFRGLVSPRAPALQKCMNEPRKRSTEDRVLWFEYRMPLIGSCSWPFGSQLVVLFGKSMETLEGEEDLLEEVSQRVDLEVLLCGSSCCSFSVSRQLMQYTKPASRPCHHTFLTIESFSLELWAGIMPLFLLGCFC